MGTTYYAGSPDIFTQGTPSLAATVCWGDVCPEENLALTAREREVLTLIGQGLYDEEIRGRLAISYHTFHRHVSSILYKLDARNRMEAFTISLRDGIIPCPRLCTYRFAGTA